MTYYPVIVDCKRNGGEVFGINICNPIHYFIFETLRILGYGIAVLINDIVSLAPFAEAVAVDERSLLRIIEILGKFRNEHLVVFLEDRILRIWSLALRVLGVFQPIGGAMVEYELRGVFSLVASVHDYAERYGKSPVKRAVNHLVEFRGRVTPGIDAFLRVECAPVRPYVTS